MADHTAPGAHDFEAMTRQYWNLWGDALRQMGGASSPQAPGWQQALDWWSRMVPGTTPAADDLLGRFRQQSGDWYGLMQQVAARFAGQPAAPADISQAWRQALGVESVQGPWQDLFRALQGGGSGGFEGWYRQITPYMEAMRRESERWLHLPTFGPAREHQERWQALALAQQDYQRCLAEYEHLMLRVAHLAFDRFETLLSARSEPGQQITSARALFDLWIDAAEQAYAEVALSPEFRRVYGALTNAQMRLKLGVQKEVEQVCLMLGMPSRTEVDSAHRKIAELERRLRRMERGARPSADAPPASAAPSAPSKEPGASGTSRAAGRARTRSTRPAPSRPAKATATRAPAKSSAAAPEPARAGARKTARNAAIDGKKPATPSAPRAGADGSKARKGGRKAAGAVVSMKDWVARYADEGKRKGK